MLSEITLAVDTVRAQVAPNAKLIFGTAYDASLHDQIRVTVLATGVTHQRFQIPGVI